MTGAELIRFHRNAIEKMHETCKNKNHDYAGSNGNTDAFANFRMVEQFGVASAEQGFFTRMCDKLSRVGSFVSIGVLKVKDESFEDTLLDFANYLIIFAAYVASKRNDAIDANALAADKCL